MAHTTSSGEPFSGPRVGPWKAILYSLAPRSRRITDFQRLAGDPRCRQQIFVNRSSGKVVMRIGKG